MRTSTLRADLDPMEPCIVTEDGLLIDWRASCPGALFGDGDETIAVDLATGDHYWVCVHCKAIVRPARAGRERERRIFD